MKLEPLRLPPSWKALGWIGALIGLSIWLALGFIAWHFLHKYW